MQVEWAPGAPRPQGFKGPGDDGCPQASVGSSLSAATPPREREERRAKRSREEASKYEQLHSAAQSSAEQPRKGFHSYVTEWLEALGRYHPACRTIPHSGVLNLTKVICK